MKFWILIVPLLLKEECSVKCANGFFSHIELFIYEFDELGT